MSGNLVVVAGHPAVGKSTLAETLCENNRGWVLLDKDTTTGPVVAAAMNAYTGNPVDRESAPYLQWVRPAEYEAFAATAIGASKYGATVVAVAPWTAQLADQRWLSNFEFDCQFAGITLTGLWIACNKAEHLDRLARRGSPLDRTKRLNLDAWHSTLTDPPLPKWMTVFDHTPVRARHEIAREVSSSLPDDIVFPDLT
jgi:predicted kinase